MLFLYLFYISVSAGSCPGGLGPGKGVARLLVMGPPMTMGERRVAMGKGEGTRTRVWYVCHSYMMLHHMLH